MGRVLLTGKACLYRCVIFWIVLAIIPDHTTRAFSLSKLIFKKAELTPFGRVYEEGETLILTCRITSATLLDQFTAKDIQFRVSLKSGNTTSYVYSNLNTTQFQVLTNSSASFTIPAVSSAYHDASVTCALPDHSLLNRKTLEVVSMPVVPRLTGCVVDAWETMTCTWGPHYLNQSHTNGANRLLYIVHWTTNRESMWHNITKGPAHKHHTDDMHKYTWSKVPGRDQFRMGEVYWINISARIDHEKLPRNHGLNIMSDVEKIRTNLIVKTRPLPVPDMTISEDRETLHVWIQRPAAAYPTKHGVRFLYRLCHSNTRTPDKKICVVSEDNTTMEVAVTPYTGYKFVLWCKPVLSQPHLWSDNTTFNYRVPMTVPKFPAVVPPHGFVITPANHLTLFWKAVPKQFHYGPRFHYTLRSRTSAKDDWQFLDTVSHNRYQLTYGSDAMHVEILACNSAGCREPKDPSMAQIFVPQQNQVLDTKPKLIVEKIRQSDTYNISLAGDGLQVEDSQTLMLYYCLAQTNAQVCKKKSDLQWRLLNTSQPFWEEVVEPISDPAGRYLFGVSVTSGDGNTTGIVWALCTYSNIALEEVTHVQVSPRSSTEILVKWLLPTRCNDQYTAGYVRAVRVYYSPHSCMEKAVASSHLVTVPGYKRLVVLPNLSPGVHYCVQVVAVTNSGASPTVRAYTVETKSVLHPLAISSLIVAMMFGLAMAGYGLYVVVVRFKEQLVKHKRNIPISVPTADPRAHMHSTSSEFPLCMDKSVPTECQDMSIGDVIDSAGFHSQNPHSGKLPTTPEYREYECTQILSLLPPNNHTEATNEDNDDVFEDPSTFRTPFNGHANGVKPWKRSDGSIMEYTTILHIPPKPSSVMSSSDSSTNTHPANFNKIFGLPQLQPSNLIQRCQPSRAGYVDANMAPVANDHDHVGNNMNARPGNNISHAEAFTVSPGGYVIDKSTL